MTAGSGLFCSIDNSLTTNLTFDRKLTWITIQTINHIVIVQSINFFNQQCTNLINLKQYISLLVSPFITIFKTIYNNVYTEDFYSTLSLQILESNVAICRSRCMVAGEETLKKYITTVWHIGLKSENSTIYRSHIVCLKG